jgi:1-acyl-sn-glycerol-3-phosphate acyltransferase
MLRVADRMSDAARQHTVAAREAADVPPPTRLLHNRHFLLLCAACGIGAFGDHLCGFALLNTHDALQSPNLTQLMARMTFVFFLPFAVLGPIAGLLADRLPRRAIMVVADVLRAALLLAFTRLIAAAPDWNGWGPLLPLGVAGLFAATFSPALNAFVPALVTPRRLIPANAALRGLGALAAMLAVVVGRRLTERYLPTIAFQLDAPVFLVGAALLLLLRPARGPAPRASHISPMEGLADGFRYIATHRHVRALVLVAALVWAAGAFVHAATAVAVRDAFGWSRYDDVGSALALWGFGIVLGAAALSLVGHALRGSALITWSLIGGGLAIGVLAGLTSGLLDPGLGAIVGSIATVASGMAAIGVIAGYSALLQRITPDRLRGRVFGITDMASTLALLAAAAMLSIPRWTPVDRWAGPILFAAAAATLAGGLAALLVRARRSRWPFPLSFWRAVNDFYCRWWFRLTRDGPARLPLDRGALVVANHTASIDPLLLVAASPIRYMGFLIAREYYNLPLFRYFIHMIGCIPVSRDGRDAAGLRATLRSLRAGHVLCVFPEGTIPAPGHTIEPKEGAAAIALMAKVPVIPAHVSGTRYSPSLVAPFFRRHHARVRYGKPIDLSPYYDRTRNRATLQEVTSLLMQQIRDLGPPAASSKEKTEATP